jgi:PPOX class probable F420-dependent enzyme
VGRLPEDAIAGLLERWPVARLATLGADRRPHQVPIVFACTAGPVLWSPVDGKPKSGGELRRVRNLSENPEVSLLLDDYDADWSRLWWLRIEATGRIVRPANPDADRQVAAALDALRAKYPQYDSIAVLRDPPTLLQFTPVSLRSWCADAGKLPF